MGFYSFVWVVRSLMPLCSFIAIKHRSYKNMVNHTSQKRGNKKKDAHNLKKF